MDSIGWRSGPRRRARARSGGRPPPFQGSAEWNARLWQRLAREVLPAYVPASRWFGGRGRVVREMSILQNVPFGDEAGARLLVVEVSFTEGPAENYLLPRLHWLSE